MNRQNEKQGKARGPDGQDPANDIGRFSPRASRVNNIVVSQAQPQQQQQGIPSKDEVEGKWKQYVGSARVAWGKLTEDELLESEGHIEKLAGLVQERYAITRDEAEKQVKSFIDKHNL